MQRSTLTRFAAALVVAGCLPLVAQSPPAAIPPTQPSAIQSSAIPTAPAPQSQPARHLAEVAFSNGQLSVVADNSSLNQILYDISRQTGMKITGGVSDERVFGHYGPAAPSSILVTLLDGTGSNMLLVSTPGHSSTPTELILTPRQGGPTPPNPNAIFAEQRDQDERDKERERLQREQEEAARRTTEAQQPNSATGTPSTADKQSPNGTKTPQQIFEQLQKMRQQPTQASPQ